MLTQDDIDLASAIGDACGRSDLCVAIDIFVHHVHAYEVRSLDTDCCTWLRTSKLKNGRTRRIVIPNMAHLLPRQFQGDRDGCDAHVRVEFKDAQNVP